MSLKIPKTILKNKDKIEYIGNFGSESIFIYSDGKNLFKISAWLGESNFVVNVVNWFQRDLSMMWHSNVMKHTFNFTDNVLNTHRHYSSKIYDILYRKIVKEGVNNITGNVTHIIDEKTRPLERKIKNF